MCHDCTNQSTPAYLPRYVQGSPATSADTRETVMCFPVELVKAGTATYLIDLYVVLGAGLKELDPKLICQSLSLGVGHLPLALLHVTLVPH